MRVLMVTAQYLPSVGGVERHVYELSRALLRRGHNVLVLHTAGSGRVTEPIEVVTTVDDAPGGRPAHHASAFWRVSRAFGGVAASTARRIEGVARRFAPAVVHQHDLSASRGVAAVLSRYVPVVWTNHTAESLLIDSVPGGARLLAAATGYVDYGIAPSHELLGTMRCMRCRRVFIPNGFDPNAIVPRRARADATVNLLVPRRMAPNKGITLLLDALNLVPDGDFSVRITGGPENGYPKYWRSVCERVARHPHKRRIHLIGTLCHSDLLEAVSLSDVVVLPSKREAVSLAGVEAMAAGVPVVATAVGGNVDLIRNGENGLLADPTPGGIAAVLRDVITHQHDLARLGSMAKSAVEQGYTWDAIARRTEEVYDEVESGRGNCQL